MYSEMFTNLYELNKTLRFELIPQGKTLDNFKKNNFLEKDKKIQEDIKDFKKIADNYFSEYIENKLNKFKSLINKDDFSLYINNINKLKEILSKTKKDEQDRKDIKLIQKDLRGSITVLFDKYKKIQTKELVKELIKNSRDNKEENVLSTFDNGFSTCLEKYIKNREFIFSEDDKHGTIAYRLINENLEIYIKNIHNIKKAIDKLYSDINRESINEIDNIKLGDITEIDNYYLFLNQSGINKYNTFIEGKREGENQKGLNELINEYNQKNKDSRIPLIRKLKKQILSDEETISIETIDDRDDLFNKIDWYIEIYNKNINKITKLLDNLNKDSKGVLLNNSDNYFSKLSKEVFKDWQFITNSMKDNYDKEHENEKRTSKYEKEKEKYLKDKDNYDLFIINKILNDIDNIDSNDSNAIIKYLSDISNEMNNIKQNIDCYNNMKNTLKRDAVNNILDDKKIETIKNLLDSYIDLLRKLKIINIDIADSNANDIFYSEFIPLFEEIEKITKVYNLSRNYLTRKRYNTKKIKINFNNSRLLTGWTESSIRNYRGIIFIEEKKGLDNYYLGILKEGKYYTDLKKCYIDNSNFKKVEYYNIDVNKTIQNLIPINGVVEKKTKNLEQLKKEYLPEEIYNIFSKKSYNKSENNFNINDKNLYIEYYFDLFSRYKPELKIKRKRVDEYEGFKDFVNDIQKQVKSLGFKYISKEKIMKLVDEDKVYLFKIYNKDFSDYHHKESNKNLHTMYWEMIFNEENLKRRDYFLSGSAEIFYREKSLDRKVTHKKDRPISNKNIYNNKKESLFKYDLIKDKRYTEDKFLFHVPISININSANLKNINQFVNNYIKENDVNIIGIDRGERNLLYYSLINNKGKILLQDSLNVIDSSYINDSGEKIIVNYDYKEKLDDIEKDNRNTRKDWKTIGTIKEVKEGYLSLAVSKIVKLAIENNAIIIMEDLNSGFKNSRKKFERNVYQQFEKALINKLSYIVDKSKDSREMCGLLKALQLVNKFESFEKMKNQNGIIYYVNPWNTSKIDPMTGFVNLFYGISNIKTSEIKDFISKIDNIIYKDDMFIFEIDYKKYNNKYLETKTKWELYTNSTRIKTILNENKKYNSTEVNLTSEFKQLFKKYNIVYEENNIKEQLLDIDNKSFYKEFINLFKLIVQLRNSDNSNDYLISPVKDKEGNFFDSRNYKENREIAKMPVDADANGAYNIARKGLIIINNIKKNKEKVYDVKNEEFLKMVQD